jgi:hypothetical protein
MRRLTENIDGGIYAYSYQNRIVNNAVDAYNHTPQVKLGGFSPYDLVYGPNTYGENGSEPEVRNDGEGNDKSDGTEEYNGGESSRDKTPRSNDEPKLSYRREGYRSGSSSSFAELFKPIKEGDLSPKLKELKWKRNQPWKAEFRSTIKPFVLGMNAEILLDKRRVNEAKRLKYSA